ncbi:MAG: YaaL family protein [Lachnospiraceae bacterium]|nr:YaaL family protein [Lachnospiraceae bacterium]
MLRFQKNQKPQNEYYLLLLDDLARTKDALDFAYANFQNVLDPDLIDAYIYEVNSVQLKYKFLLGRVKQMQNVPPTTPTAC